MGTNTWNYYHCNIDENIVKKLADSFVANGMAAVGYQVGVSMSMSVGLWECVRV
jgi:hypothetical protein